MPDKDGTFKGIFISKALPWQDITCKCEGCKMGVGCDHSIRPCCNTGCSRCLRESKLSDLQP